MSVELYGDEVNKLTLDERITISSMATEMGAIAIIIPPSDEVITLLRITILFPYCSRFMPIRMHVYQRNMCLISELFSSGCIPSGPTTPCCAVKEVKGIKD